ncbi:MAG: hypothetical protein J0L76_21780, partial [Rhodobacterales bacterium]|nr:hypothetical protein [Rhodobacterales bacterium]
TGRWKPSSAAATNTSDADPPVKLFPLCASLLLPLAVAAAPQAPETTPTELPGAKTLVYRESPGPMRLFVVKPAGWKATDRRPALMFFFGGGWTTGTPKNSIFWAKFAADLGMVGIAPDYRTKGRNDVSPLGSVADSRAALWLGPDEFLLLAPGEEAAAVEAGMKPALSAGMHSLVDVSHRQIGLVLEGRLAARCLSAGCPLDLRPAAFPVGMATRTIFLKTEIVLWRQALDRFHIEVWRSFAPYLVGHLAEAFPGTGDL